MFRKEFAEGSFFEVFLQLPPECGSIVVLDIFEELLFRADLDRTHV